MGATTVLQAAAVRRCGPGLVQLSLPGKHPHYGSESFHFVLRVGSLILRPSNVGH